MIVGSQGPLEKVMIVLLLRFMTFLRISRYQCNLDDTIPSN